jgi:hypothetical protein
MYLLAFVATAGLGLGLTVPTAFDAPGAGGAVADTLVVDAVLAGTTADGAVDGKPEGVEDAESDVSVAAAKGFRYGGPIKRAKVIERARHWFNAKVPYSQSAYHFDKNKGKRYRTDCSGFVSMAWGLKKSRVTWTLDDVSKAITYANLRPGDILLIQHRHVMLFHKWANKAHTSFWIYEQGSTASDMNHRVVTVGGAKSAGYQPRRYQDIRPNS